MCIPPHGLLDHIHSPVIMLIKSVKFRYFSGWDIHCIFMREWGEERFVLLDHQKAYNHNSSREHFDALGEILSPDTA